MFSDHLQEAQRSRTASKVSKYHQQRIAMFQYYSANLLPRLFEKTSHLQSNKTHQVTDRGLVYNYFSRLAPFESLSLSQLEQNVRKNYSSGSITPGQGPIQRESQVKLSWLPVSWQVSEEIEVMSRQATKMGSILKTNSNTPNTSRLSKQSSAKNSEQAVYVFHNLLRNSDETSSPQWQQFMERYIIQVSSNQQPTLKHQIIFVYPSTNFFSLSQSGRLLSQFYQSHINGMPPLPKIFQQHHENRFLKNGSQETQNNEQFRRELRLKDHQLPVFKLLQSQVNKYYAQIHPNSIPRPEFIDNMICRFLFDNDYDQEKTLTDAKYYLDYDKQMRQRYTLESFKEFMDMNVYEYVGEDHQGRPVLIFNIRNQLFSQIKDIDRYLDFYFFYTDLGVTDRSKGWADEALVLWDGRDFVMDNFNIGTVKRLIERSFKVHYFSRQYRVLSFNNGFVIKGVLNLVKSLLPKNVVELMTIMGNDQKEIKQEMEKYMPTVVAQRCLAGKNK